MKIQSTNSDVVTYTSWGLYSSCFQVVAKGLLIEMLERKIVPNICTFNMVVYMLKMSMLWKPKPVYGFCLREVKL